MKRSNSSILPIAIVGFLALCALLFFIDRPKRPSIESVPSVVSEDATSADFTVPLISGGLKHRPESTPQPSLEDCSAGIFLRVMPFAGAELVLTSADDLAEQIRAKSACFQINQSALLDHIEKLKAGSVR